MFRDDGRSLRFGLRISVRVDNTSGFLIVVGQEQPLHYCRSSDGGLDCFSDCCLEVPERVWVSVLEFVDGGLAGAVAGGDLFEGVLFQGGEGVFQSFL